MWIAMTGPHSLPYRAVKEIGTAALALLVLAGTNTLILTHPARGEGDVHGEYSIKIAVGADEGDDTDHLELRRGAKLIASYEATGYVKDAFWSEDGKWVAANVRDANSGDYVWVLSLKDGAIVRQANNDVEEPWEKAAYAAFERLDRRAVPDNMTHYWKAARGFSKDGKLMVGLRADYVGVGRLDYVVPMIVSAEGLQPGGAARVTLEKP